MFLAVAAGEFALLVAKESAAYHLPMDLVSISSAIIFISAIQVEEVDRLRGEIAKAFTPKRYKALEPSIRETVIRMIDAIDAKTRDGGTCDYVRELAFDLPAITIMTMLGAPLDKLPQVKRWAESRALLTWGDLSDDE